MQLQIESTQTMAHIEGVKCRLWKGTTEKGHPVAVYVHLIMSGPEADPEMQAAMDAGDLAETTQPLSGIPEGAAQAVPHPALRCNRHG